MRPPPIPGILASATLALACAGAADESTAPALELTASPAFQLASSVGDSVLFERAHAATLLEDGGVVVLDGSARQLVFFDSAGRLSHRVGRQGEGPGEFVLPLWLGRCGDDSLYVGDVATSRISVFDATGTYHRTFTIPLLGSGRLACNLDGMLFATRFPEEAMYPPSSTEFPPLIGRGILYSSAGDSVGAVPAVDVGINRPLGRVTSVVLERDAILVGTADTSALDRYGMDGTHLGRISFEAPVRTVSDSLYLAFVDDLSQLPGDDATSRNRVREMLLRSPKPDRVPSYRHLLVDPLGWKWLVTSLGIDPVTRLVAIDPDGSPRVVELPESLEVLEVGSTHILAKGSDEDGADRIVAYRIHGRESTSHAVP